MTSQELTKNVFTVSSAPFWHSGRTLPKTMLNTLLALLPAAIMAVYRYGYGAVEVIAWAGLTAVITETLVQKLMGQKSAADNYSALVDGILFAFLLPSTLPAWMVVIGSAMTIILGRMVFGGFGGSPICAPAMGWAILTISWPDFMDLNGMLLQWDLVEPLSELKYFGLGAVESIPWQSLLFREYLGALGASHALMILLGGIYLLIRRAVRWYIPLSFIAGVLLTGQIFAMVDPHVYVSPLFHLFSGSTLFAAFFLMPYSSSSPVWRIPMVLFGLFGGALAVVIRTYGIYPDGVPFAVLLMNLCTPLLDLIQPKPFGGR